MFNKKISYLLIGLTFIFITLLFVSASTVIDNQESDFDLGTYNFTFYNYSGFVQLNSSRLNGTIGEKLCC